MTSEETRLRPPDSRVTTPDWLPRLTLSKPRVVFQILAEPVSVPKDLEELRRNISLLEADSAKLRADLLLLTRTEQSLLPSPRAFTFTRDPTSSLSLKTLRLRFLEGNSDSWLPRTEPSLTPLEDSALSFCNYQGPANWAEI